MSNGPRLDEPGALHHVWTRGVDRCPIYLDDADRRRFLATVALVLKEGHGRCLAWALMDNHYHLLLETGGQPLWRVMQRINQRHAQWFNRRHGRTGHLFEGPYDSARVGDDEHLATLVAYIHLNPVRAGMVSDVAALESYPWTGHAALMGRTPQPCHDADRALAAFGETRRTARRGVRECVAAVHARGMQMKGRAGEVTFDAGVQARDRVYGVRRVRGRWRFIDRVTRDMEARDVRHARFRRAGWTADAVAVCAAQRLGARIDDVREGRRTSAETRARAVAAYLAWHCVGATKVEIGRALGVTGPAVSMAIGRGRRLFDAGGEGVAEFLTK